MTEEESLPDSHRSRSAEYDVLLIEDVRIPSSVPGLTLGADLFLPVTDKEVPALVTMHSARKDGIGGIGARKYLRYFAERGYATLYVDCFGIGTSEGEPRPMLSPGEIDDGVGVVEWAAQQSWCTGSVGMWGLSHGGMTTLAVASRRPHSLRAIFPVMGWTDMENDLVYPYGLRSGIAMFGHLSLFNIFCALLPSLREGDRAEYEPVWKERLEKFEPWFVDAWRHEAGHRVWRDRRFDPALIDVPAFCVTGWRDLFCGAMIRAYQQIRAPKKLLVGPWLHSFPDAASADAFPSVALACEWWDRWLHQSTDTLRDKATATVYIQGANGRWAQTSQWPPRNTRQHIYDATTSGHLRLRSECGVRSAQRSTAADIGIVTHRSDLTVGTLSGLTKHPTDRWGHPLDQHDDDTRSLSFTSLPTPKPLIIAGNPTVRLALDMAASASRCVIKLADVDSLGRSTLITSRAIRLPTITNGQRDSPSVIAFSLDPTCYRIASGHRLRLVLSESDFPALWPPSTVGSLSIRVHDSAATETHQQAAIAAAAATTLQLPICEPEELSDIHSARFAEAGQRTREGQTTDRWEITRDHLDRLLRLRLEKTDRAPHTRGIDKFLTMHTNIECSTHEESSSNAIMTAYGECAADLNDGNRVVVKGNITMRTVNASVAAVITMNDAIVYSKKWDLGAECHSSDVAVDAAQTPETSNGDEQ